MNDPVFLEAARALALRALRESQADARLDHLFQLCLARAPLPDEWRRLQSFAADQRARVRAAGAEALKVLGPETVAPADQEDATVLVALARVLLNLDEFINRE
jgi:hypothetical protein